MSNTKKNIYDASTVQTLEGLEAVRALPGMYIGNTGLAGVFHLFREVFDNSKDEFTEGHCTEILVDINEQTNQITVSDNGRGMPIEKIHDLVSKLHTSGKFKTKDEDGNKKSNNYKYSIGMHGVGIKAVNALSDKMVVIVSRDGLKHRIEYSKGKLVEDIKVIGKTKDTGTYISFHPDKEVLLDIDIDHKVYYDYCEQTSFLSRGLRIKYHATKRENKSEVVKEFYNKNGLIDYIKHIEKHLISKPVEFELEADDKVVELALAYRKSDEESMLSFCNGLQTVDGGTHETGFRQGLTNVLLKYIKDNKILPKKDESLEIIGDDTREGLVAILVTKHPEPQFFGQTKDKLTSVDIKGICTKIVSDNFSKYLKDNPDEARKIALKVIQNAKGRIAAKRAKANVSKKSEGYLGLSTLSKFTNCSSSNPEECELFIVEGNSAGGSAEQGRNPETQAIYKLKGKPLNTFSRSLTSIQANKEFKDLINILGCGIGSNFDITKLRFHKIILACDSDVDGYHILSLLDAFFYKHMTDLVVNGHLYHARPPLYRITEGKKEKYIVLKEDYNKYLRDKIYNTYSLVVKGKDGKAMELPKDKYYSILTNSYKYTRLLEDLATRLATKPEVLEYIALYYGGKNFESSMKSLGLSVIQDKETLVEGLYGEDYICLVISNEVKKYLMEIRNQFKEFGLGQVISVNKKTNEKKSTTIGKFLVEAYNKVAPNNKTRYKGLGEMNAEDLYSTTLDPNKRTIIQLSVDDFKSTDIEMEIQVGKDADKRKDSMEGYTINIEDLDR